MSVFGVKDTWLAQLGSGEEEFDVNSMCWIQSLGVVVTASLQGVLRICCPQQRRFQPEDLVLETILQPILQVASGEFLRGSDEQALAVLHSKSLSVYSLQRTESISTLNLRYNIIFKYNLFNFTFGRIGAIRSMIICIQSADGELMFCENETKQFAIKLPLNVVPEPLTWCGFNNSIIVCNANMEVESYNYANLYRAEEERIAGRDAKYASEFIANLGEYALAVEVDEVKRTVLVLGEHSIFVLSERLEFLMIKRLDYPPSCFLSFINERSQQMLVVGSFTGHLLVYEGQHLVWTAKCDDSPIVMKRVELLLPGLLLMLSETGRLRISYLGTSPLPHAIVPPQPVRPVDVMEAELFRCQELLTGSGSSGSNKPQLVMSINVEPEPREEPHFIEGFVSESALITTYATITVNTLVQVSNLTIQICTAKGLEANENPLTLENLPARGTHSFTVGFNTKANHFVASLDGRLSYAYKIDKSCRVGELPFRLPLAQIAVVTSASEYSHQIIFSILGNPIQLPRIFPDFPSSSNSIYLRFFSGECASINPSKVGNKIQIAGSDFSVLGLIAEELNYRLQQVSCSLAYNDIPPISFLLSSIDIHFKCRKAQAESEAELTKLMEQFIAVEKRLLTRFKDKSPAPINNLDYLLQKTLKQLEDLTVRIEELQFAAQVAGEKLSGIMRLTIFTAKNLFNLSNADVEVLSSHLPIEVTEDEVGWEELALSGVIELLRTKLAKNDRERNVSRGSLDFPANTEQLKKNIGIVFERLSKGQKLS